MPFAELSLSDSATQRRAKIVATLGPASNTETVFRDLVRAGIDVVRLNFSHGTHEEKLALIQMIRKISREERRPLCILGDLQGPKIRLGRFAGGPVEWRTGEEVRITVDDVAGTHDRVSTTYTGLADDARPGGRCASSATCRAPRSAPQS
jgi:pyruvate kinase